MRRIDRAVEIALRLRQARAEAGKLMDEIEKLTGGGGAPSVEERNGTSPPPAVQGGRYHRYLVQNNRGGAGPARVAELRELIASGKYVPFAELRAAFAGAVTVPSAPCDRELERNRRKRQRYDAETRRAQQAAYQRAYYARNRERELARTKEQARRRREAARAAPAEASP